MTPTNPKSSREQTAPQKCGAVLVLSSLGPDLYGRHSLESPRVRAVGMAPFKLLAEDREIFEVFKQRGIAGDVASIGDQRCEPIPAPQHRIAPHIASDHSVEGSMFNEHP